MKLKTFAAGALLAVASFAASAATTPLKPVTVDFSNKLLGTFTVSSLSDVVGNVFATTSTTNGSATFTLADVTFSGATVGNSTITLTDLDSSITGFKFHNVTAGTYKIFASGSVAVTEDAEVGIIGANYSVTAVPEPETYGMLLGGLALLGAVARRKAKKAA